MKTFVMISFCMAVVSALPLDIFQDENGEEYVLLPLQRERREVTWGANQGGYGLGAKGNVFNGNNHQLDGSVGASKAWGSHGIKPDTFGGPLDYSHKPSGSSAFVGANRTPGWGTDLSAGGKYNIAGGKNWALDATGQYERHYGGPVGTLKPNYGVGLNLNGKF